MSLWSLPIAFGAKLPCHWCTAAADQGHPANPGDVMVIPTTPRFFYISWWSVMGFHQQDMLMSHMSYCGRLYKNDDLTMEKCWFNHGKILRACNFRSHETFFHGRWGIPEFSRHLGKSSNWGIVQQAVSDYQRTYVVHGHPNTPRNSVEWV
jgi:hypothetical protein